MCCKRIIGSYKLVVLEVRLPFRQDVTGSRKLFSQLINLIKCINSSQRSWRLTLWGHNIVKMDEWYWSWLHKKIENSEFFLYDMSIVRLQRGYRSLMICLVLPGVLPHRTLIFFFSVIEILDYFSIGSFVHIDLLYGFL